MLHGAPLKCFQLVEHIRAIVARLAHPFVEVVERGVGHLQSFCRDGCHAAQVCLIALIFEDGFLSELNSMLLFKLLDQRFQELLLRLHLLDFSFNLESNPLLHAPLVHFIATDLGKQLHVTQRPEKKTSLVEVLAELFTSLLLLNIGRVLFPLAEKLLCLVCVAPLVDPPHYDGLITITL